MAKTFTLGLMRASPSSTAQVPRDDGRSSSARPIPKVLVGRGMPKNVPLPADFDRSYHLKIVKAGSVKPMTSEDYDRKIAELKARIG